MVEVHFWLLHVVVVATMPARRKGLVELKDGNDGGRVAVAVVVVLWWWCGGGVVVVVT